jgi:uncharacterized protein
MDSQELERKRVLETSKVIAIVGLSPDPEKASNGVAAYLKKAGYRIIPVNPQHEEILGEKAYKTLSDIPEKVDVVDVFMRAEKVVPVVEEAIKIKPKAVWLQLGIASDVARRIVEEKGIPFFQDICIKQEHARLFGK